MNKTILINSDELLEEDPESEHRVNEFDVLQRVFARIRANVLFELDHREYVVNVLFFKVNAILDTFHLTRD
jgi:hypothetical protein